MSDTSCMFNDMRDAYADIAQATYPDVMTITRPTGIQSDVGGTRVGTPLTLEPQKIPCKYWPASDRQKELATKMVSGTLYNVRVPAKFNDLVVDLDSNCTLTVSRTDVVDLVLRVDGIQRERGRSLKIMASTEE